MASTIETLFKITAAVIGSNALRDFSNEIAKASTNGQNLKRTLNQGSIALKAFAYSEAVQGLRRIATGAINLGAQLDEISQKTGVSVETLGRLKGAADQAGLNLDSVATAVNKLNQNLIEAQDGTSKQAAAFAALGIKTTDSAGQLRRADDILLEMADKFKNSADGAGKTAVSMALLGKAGADMIPLLNKGSEEIQNLGLAVGPEFARQADLFNSNISKIKTQFDQLSIDVASQVLPGMVALSEGFEKNNTAVKLLVGLIRTLETSFVGWSYLASAAVNAVGEEFATLAVKVSGLYDMLKAFGTLKWSTLDDISARTDASVKAVQAESARQQSEARARAQAQINAIWSSNVGSGAAANGPASVPGGGKPEIGYRGDTAAKAASEFERAEKAAEKWLAKQREGLITLQQEASYIGLTSVEVTKLKDARAFESEVAEKAREMTKAQAEAFKEQASEIEKTRQKIIQYNYEQARTFGAGAKEFFTKYAETASDTAAQVKDALTGAFKSAEDALVEFTMTGKLNFKNFARSIIEDLIRIQIQRSITGPISNVLGSFFSSLGPATVTASAMGNVMTEKGPLPLRRYAAGGIARSPQVALYGEGRLPEAYVPLPDGRRIPVAMQGNAGAVGDVNVNVTIQNNGTAQESAQASTRRGSEFGRAVAAAVKAQIIEEQRPGGLLAGA